jgi:iron complex outermembrane receptor protein
MKTKIGLSLIIGVSQLGLTGIAYAQEAATDSSGDEIAGDEIVVSARKRDETSISVPVVVTAIGAAEIERRAINNLDSLSRVVPQLLVGPSGGTAQGGNITIRGIAGPDTAAFGDQAVSFNIDGVAVSKANVRRMTETDIGQVEVLKGPQALFYGKNSPGGIITIRTADPTQDWQGKVSAGYEFRGDEIRTEGYVAGPLSDTLGIRIAGTFSDMKGWQDSTPIPDAIKTAFGPGDGSRSPDATNYGGRVTLVYKPDDRFSARFKFNYSKLDDNSGATATRQYIVCTGPGGTPRSGFVDDCKANRFTSGNVGVGARAKAAVPEIFGKDAYQKQDQILSSLELNYQISDHVQLTSVTGYYDVSYESVANYQANYGVALEGRIQSDNKEFSQEFRINTSYDGPLNFTAGLFYGESKSRYNANAYIHGYTPEGLAILNTLFAPTPLALAPKTNPIQMINFELNHRGKTYSAYGQLSYKPIDVLEINGGVRYSLERKRLPAIYDEQFDGAYNPFGYNPLTEADRVNNPGLRTKGSWSNYSPEVTVTYRPSQNLTVFGSYKHAFLSGGFNTAASVGYQTSTAELSFDPQTIKGFESGIKFRALDGALRGNFSAYTYKLEGLQLTQFVGTTSLVRNAAAGKVKGVDFDLNYRTPIEGLSLNGAVAYNDAKYTDFKTAPCYTGQSAPACTAGRQDLSGGTPPRAPEWSGSAGFNFDTTMADFKLGLSGGLTFNSSFTTDLASGPSSVQKGYTLFDASIRFGAADDRWELALIGRNLTDKYYVLSSIEDTIAQLAFPGQQVDRYGDVSRGRELMLRATYRFGGK